MRSLIAIAPLLVLTACATAPKMVWTRTDGQPIAEYPLNARKFEQDRLACTGEMQKANLSGVNICNGIADCAISGAQRNQAMNAVGLGCMADRGYVQVSEDEWAATKSVQLRARDAPTAPIGAGAPQK